jgi:hypothetical protein
MAYYFFQDHEMIRGLLHIEQFKNYIEHFINCWLSYSMSQPVNVDLAMVVFFIFQYFGFRHLETTSLLNIR